MEGPLRFLVDHAVSPVIAEALRAAGYDAVSLRDRRLTRAKDPVLVEMARHEDRVIVTQDLGFGALLIIPGDAKPSIVLFRDRTGRPETQIALLLKALPEVAQALRDGAIVVIDDADVRTRRLGGAPEASGGA